MSTLPKHPHELIGLPDRSAAATTTAKSEVRHGDERAQHRIAGDERADCEDRFERAADADERAAGGKAERAERVRGVGGLERLERATEREQHGCDREGPRQNAHRRRTLPGKLEDAGHHVHHAVGCGQVGAHDRYAAHDDAAVARDLDRERVAVER